MSSCLVIQLARLGDLLQTKRLLLGLDAAYGPGRVHLLVDKSLTGLAQISYPFARVHGIRAFGGKVSLPDLAAENRRSLSSLTDLDFDAVYNLNYSGLSLALSRLFPREIMRGHWEERGMARRSLWADLAFRWTAQRRMSPLNLIDFWGLMAPQPVPAAEVNPAATPKGGGLGVVLAGRMARRSLPPEILAPIVRTAFRASGAQRLTLLGTAAQAAEARALVKQLDPATASACQDLTGRTGLGELCEVIASLDRLLTPDTGAMHLAAFYGVPVTAFFLSSAWCHETGPYGVGHEVWQSVVPCAPCLESVPCDKGHVCRLPFAEPALLRLLGGSAKAEPPAGLALFRTDCDALGAVCRLERGEDASEAGRRAFRAFAARHLAGQDAALAEGTAEAALAERFFLETDWTLPPPGRDAAGVE